MALIVKRDINVTLSGPSRDTGRRTVAVKEATGRNGSHSIQWTAVVVAVAHVSLELFAGSLANVQVVCGSPVGFAVAAVVVDSALARK